MSRRNADDRLRELERLAATGDADALAKLFHEKQRIGRPDAITLGEMSMTPISDVVTLLRGLPPELGGDYWRRELREVTARVGGERSLGAPAGADMPISEFWHIVERSGGDEDELREILSSLTPEQVLAFAARFRSLHAAAYRWDLWGAAYLLSDGCSDDGFIDFRNGLIMQGMQVYTSALRDPDSLADVDVESSESVGSAASRVFEEMTGSEMPTSEVEQPEEPVGETWRSELELRRRLPRIAARMRRARRRRR